MDQLISSIFIFLSTLISFSLSQGDDPYGFCGTQPTDTFTFIEDAEKPFCFKFKNAVSSHPNNYLYYYFGTRVDTYTLVSLQGCMLYKYVYIYIHIYHINNNNNNNN